jgi:hypothetical protein
MRYIQCSCFLVFVLQIALAQPPADKGYTLLFDECFKGNHLNEADWRYRIDRRTGFGYMDGLNRKENVFVKDGALHVVLNHEKIDGKWENTGGGIISKHNFGYGYYECLSKPFIEGHGVHTSFWQRGAKNPNNDIFEIDSYEIDSKTWAATNNLYFDLPYKGLDRRPWPHRAQVPFSLDKDGWFLDAYEFTPAGVNFYDNGKIVAKAEWDQLNAHQAVWLTALNGVGKVDSTKQPAESVFKYFRYYAKDYPGITILPNGNFEYNQAKYNPQKPLCWNNVGTNGAIHVIEGGAYLENYKLRIGAPAPFKASIMQQLEFIRNGEYQFSAMVRSSGGQDEAFLKISDYGGKDLVLKVPASGKWIKLAIPVKVSNNQVTISIGSKGSVDQWMEVDEVLFYKPLADVNEGVRAKPFATPTAPIWKLAESEPIEFVGDQKFYFFDRNVGFGDSIAVSVDLVANELANMTPIARIPKKGNSGWSIQLKKDGCLVFRIGSIENHTDIIADNIYQAGQKIQLTCEFINGTAFIYKGKELIKKQSGITQNTKDATAAGRVGTVGRDFEAVGDVVMQVGNTDKESQQLKNFRGSIQHLKIYNRKLIQ